MFPSPAAPISQLLPESLYLVAQSPGKAKTGLTGFLPSLPWPLDRWLQVPLACRPPHDRMRGLPSGCLSSGSALGGPGWSGPHVQVLSWQCEAERALPEHLGLPGHHQEQPGQSSGPAVAGGSAAGCRGGQAGAERVATGPP